MPVITVDGKKVAVPKGENLSVVVSKLLPASINITYNGARILNYFNTKIKDGDVIYRYSIVDDLEGDTVEDYIEETICEDYHYRVLVNGTAATYKTALKNGDRIEFYICIPISVQDYTMYVQDGTTIEDLQNKFNFIGTVTVNGKKEPPSYILQEDDVVKISKNH